MPEGAVYVGRPSIWGNRWKPGVFSRLLGKNVETADEAVRCFRELANVQPHMKAFVREQLGGKDLACWCSLDKPCHADVLLEIANS